MEAIRGAALRLAAFSAAAGLAEALMPEGKARRIAEGIWRLLALRLLVGLVANALWALLP